LRSVAARTVDAAGLATVANVILRAIGILTLTRRTTVRAGADPVSRAAR
jgi:hypothetical protein